MNSDLKEVYSGLMGQVDLIKAFLESENIECFYGDESIGSYIPDITKSIYVSNYDYDKAIIIIDSLEQGDDSSAEDYPDDDNAD